ncbi:lipoprotein [Desulfuromonas carbonis]|uniref:glycine betaine ABC transporter substrate-binding protein n=1 Tax=Desulfuromonas sp. DDH964 TaxID=1823759 RepID=UPI00078C2834|nr:glycine betaine ABC transporter substrate-binding protein [Desulfuromonas sp. DDH964]AMV73229.1 lipoprotein [Desulfuromonas sp. DDH964]
MPQKILRSLLLFLTLALAVSLTVPVPSAQGCVGKTLVIASTGTVQQDLLAEIIALLIGERTGTTVKVIRVASPQAAHEALLKAELDISVEYTGAGQLNVLHGEAIADPKALFEVVKTRYNQDLNLIWLQPFGFDEPGAVTTAIPAEAAPVVRKDTLKKFPALTRLINKLGGTIDGATMKRLEAQAASGKVREVARSFLKDNRLI